MRNKLLLLGVFGLVGLAFFSSAWAQDKEPVDPKAYYDGRPPFDPLADVNEDELVNNTCPGQAVNCGDAYHGTIPTGGTSGDQDYFKFYVTAGTVITVETMDDGATPVGDTYMYLYNPSCVQVATNDDISYPTNAYSRIVYTALVTGEYSARVRSYSATYTGGYKATITCAAPEPPPVNDTCAGAIEIFCGNINLAGTTQWAIADYDPYQPVSPYGCTGFHANGKDMVYKFTVGPGGVIDVTYVSTTDASFYIVTDCANVPGSCVIGADDAAGTEVINHTFASGGTYYLILDSYSAGTWGTWTLTGTLNGCPVPTRATSWGAVKNIYR